MGPCTEAWAIYRVGTLKKPDSSSFSSYQLSIAPQLEVAAPVPISFNARVFIDLVWGRQSQLQVLSEAVTKCPEKSLPSLSSLRLLQSFCLLSHYLPWVLRGWAVMQISPFVAEHSTDTYSAHLTSCECLCLTTVHCTNSFSGGTWELHPLADLAIVTSVMGVVNQFPIGSKTHFTGGKAC